MGVAFGPLRPFAAARTPSSARGQVARGTFSGPRSRGTRWGPWRAAPSTPPKHATGHDAANGASARTPNHLPRHASGTPARGGPPSVVAGRWWCPRAEAPFAVSWLFERLDRDDAAGRCGPGWRPASVGRRTGAPPPPWGAVAGGLALRGQTGFARSPGPPALARRLACAQQRTAAKGRPRIPILLRLNAQSYQSASASSALTRMRGTRCGSRLTSANRPSIVVVPARPDQIDICSGVGLR